jgi:hypothetical protein
MLRAGRIKQEGKSWSSCDSRAIKGIRIGEHTENDDGLVEA